MIRYISFVFLFLCALTLTNCGSEERERKEITWTIDGWISTKQRNAQSGVLRVDFIKDYSPKLHGVLDHCDICKVSWSTFPKDDKIILFGNKYTGRFSTCEPCYKLHHKEQAKLIRSADLSAAEKSSVEWRRLVIKRRFNALSYALDVQNEVLDTLDPLTLPSIEFVKWHLGGFHDAEEKNHDLVKIIEVIEAKEYELKNPKGDCAICEIEWIDFSPTAKITAFEEKGGGTLGICTPCLEIYFKYQKSIVGLVFDEKEKKKLKGTVLRNIAKYNSLKR